MYLSIYTAYTQKLNRYFRALDEKNGGEWEIVT